jgi:hypothetical protein
MTEVLGPKHTVNVCQIYAYNRIQQGDSWQGDPWTECESIIERDFGRPAVTFSEAFFLNPRPILEHIWWNIKLIPSGTQLALFSYYSGGPNPDYMPAKKNPLVWVPFLFVVGLSVFAAIVYFIIPGIKKRYAPENVFAWVLMLSAALMIFGIMMMQRPRPSYMFPYTLFIMSLTGLGLHKLLEFLRMSNTVRNSLPIVGVLFILLWPSYYDADYISHFGYKGQSWRDVYERVAPHIERTPGNSPTVIVTPPGYYGNLCDYLGVTCRVLDGNDLISVDRMKELVAAYPEENVYLLYLEEMIWKHEYVELRCYSVVYNVMTCSDGTIDLNKGLMNDGTTDIPLRAALFVNNGYVVDRKNYRTDDPGYYLQILMKNNKPEIILVADEGLFQTNLNQQFLLGNFDRRYFNEQYLAPLEARILKATKAAADDVIQKAPIRHP